MKIHPDLKNALDTNLSALEVIRLFTKHHSGVPEKRIGLRTQYESKPSDSSFWDTWQPLCHKLHRFSDPESPPASEAFLNIHQGLTREVISWLCDSGRRSNVYLIEEAQTRTENVNENYRANAFASICYDAHRFGLPLRGAPSTPPDVSLLCAVLAAHYPPFRCILAKTLIDNSDILDLPTRTQFKKLIYEPWKALQISHPQYVTAPPVIVLRYFEPAYWDEKLLRSICEFASPRHAPPLLWIISFSPKCKLPILDLFDSFECPRLTRVPVCYNDASADTKSFLYHRFSILREKHMEMFTEHEVWPSEEQISHLTRIFQGAVDAVDVVTQFVDYKGRGGPKAHLETFLTYMVDSPSPSNEQPYRALDHFYTRVFSAIPHDLLSVVKRVLCFCYWEDRYDESSSIQLAWLLSLGHDVVLEVLQHLSRWAVAWHTKDEANWCSPCPFFRSFLEGAERSGPFSISKSEMRFLTYKASLCIISYASNPSKSLKFAGGFEPNAHISEIEDLIDHVLVAFYYAADIGSHPEWTLLRRFDFRCLAHTQNPIHLPNFIPFFKRLHAWDKNNSPNIVRVKPAGPLDRQFIEKCEGLAEPLDLEEKVWWWELRPTGPKYVLLGFEAGTVLVVVATDRVPGVKPIFYGCTFYTSAMLEYM